MKNSDRKTAQTAAVKTRNEWKKMSALVVTGEKAFITKESKFLEEISYPDLLRSTSSAINQMPIENDINAQKNL